MRLLNTTTGEFRWFNDPREVRYAILSHVWSSEGERSFQEVQELRRSLNPTWGPRDDWQSPVGNALLGTPREDTSTLLASLSQSFRELCLYALDQNFTRLGDKAQAYKNTPEDYATPPTPLSLLCPKVRAFCTYASEQGYVWAWADACCIDKSSSAELSESINSMFYWYAQAGLCVAYLADVSASDGDPRAVGSQFRESKWWTRGWTLQELLAPANVVFVSAEWCLLGTKTSLARPVEEITGVQDAVLRGRVPLSAVSVARRMSWAARRVTTRVEDEAYALMGIFGVTMVTNYGEGTYAFTRLQEEILKRVPDQSLFAWGTRSLTDSTGVPTVFNFDSSAVVLQSFDGNQSSAASSSQHHISTRNLLASSPRDFSMCSDVSIEVADAEHPHLSFTEHPYITTSYGVRTRMPLIVPPDPEEKNGMLCVAVLGCYYPVKPEAQQRPVAEEEENPYTHKHGRLGLLLYPNPTSGADAYVIGTVDSLGSTDTPVRVVELPEDVLRRAVNDGVIVERDVHLLNQTFTPTVTHTGAVSWLGMKVALLGEWRIRQLEELGYTTTCETAAATHPDGPLAHRFVFLRKCGTAVKVEVNICALCAFEEGGSPWRAVRVVVSAFKAIGAEKRNYGSILERQMHRVVHSKPLLGLGETLFQTCNREDHVDCGMGWVTPDSLLRSDGGVCALSKLPHGDGEDATSRHFVFGELGESTIEVWVKMDPAPYEQGNAVGSTFYTLDVDILLDQFEQDG
ncbi:hypothetical protein C8Q79DRAFT_778317 [Trametes meyenii]|nr:hypothetical protein C8Q79DRAFT_778317 [Trametes meyenii]